MGWIRLGAMTIVGAMLLVGCASRMVSVRHQENVALEYPQADVEVRAAIIRAIEARRYEVDDEQPGRLVALYHRGDVGFRFAVDYSGTNVTVSLVDAMGLDVAQDPETGEQLVDARIERWMVKLARTIDDELERPAREAAEQEQRRRDHQLAVAQAQAAAAAPQPEPREQPQQPQAQPGHEPVANTTVRVVGQLAPRIDLGGGGGVNVSHEHRQRSSEQTLTCCINGAFYSCPGQAAFESCLSDGPSQCTRDASRDSSCN